MKKEINPKETSRAQAYELWMKAPNPMVTFFKTIDVTRIVKVSRRKGLKFNLLLDWCIGRAVPGQSARRNQQTVMVLQRASLEDYDSIIAFYDDVIERTPDVEKYARWQKGKAPQGSRHQSIHRGSSLID